MVRFLIIRLSSIGDIVLTTPVIRILKKQVENSEIHFLTKKQYYQVIAHNPYIDNIWLYDKNMPKLLNILKKQEFDYIIDLHNNLRTFRIKNSLRILSFSFNKINIAKWLMVNFKLNYLPVKHIVERYLDTIKIFDVENDGEGLNYYTGKEDEIFPDNISTLIPADYVALCIGGQHFTKKMPPGKLADLCEKIKLPVVLLGGKEDINEAGIISQSVKSNCVINLTGKLSLNNSAVIVRNSKVVVTHDTGLMHIAAAYKKKIISIWGNTIPAFGMVPYMPGRHSQIAEVNGLTCRPCSKIGYKKCPKNHFKCMMEQDNEKIAGWVNEDKE